MAMTTHADPQMERERKFLVDDLAFLHDHQPRRIAQGYLAADDRVELRIRLAASDAFLTVKSGEAFITREEYEMVLPSKDLAAALISLTSKRIVKDRYSVVVSEHLWDIDVFLGDNEGLAIAELEVADRFDPVNLPPWCGTEVTGVQRYYNRSLAEEPYSRWPAEWR
jgi:CYTH domain-containing protein